MQVKITGQDISIYINIPICCSFCPVHSLVHKCTCCVDKIRLISLGFWLINYYKTLCWIVIGEKHNTHTLWTWIIFVFSHLVNFFFTVLENSIFYLGVIIWAIESFVRLGKECTQVVSVCFWWRCTIVLTVFHKYKWSVQLYL